MGEILGIGCTHAPHLPLTDGTMANIYFRYNLRHEKTPAYWKDPANWPRGLIEEWGDDEGQTAARKHRAELVAGFRAARQAMDDFQPDFVLIYGDDQYENFREDLLPPFCAYASDELTLRSEKPRGGGGGLAAKLGLPLTRIEMPPLQATASGSKQLGTYVANELTGRGIDVACSWKLHHMENLGHAFSSTIDYLDWDRRGFPYPVIPFHVSCYGEDLRVPSAESREVTGRLMEDVAVRPPVSPPPWRCYDLGKALAEAIADSPYRAVVIGSSSWSHASLTDMHGYLWGDVDSDREHLEQLRSGQIRQWRELDPDQIRRSGQHEMRNWICLAGSMEGRTPRVLAYSESYVFNSSKCVALFPAN
ncbi:MAG TPA: extradiol ring-cleavage dioxygenase [Chloroflexota bacterium]